METQTLPLRLPEPLLAAARQRAAESDMTVAQLIRQLLARECVAGAPAEDALHLGRGGGAVPGLAGHHGPPPEPRHEQVAPRRMA